MAETYKRLENDSTAPPTPSTGVSFQNLSVSGNQRRTDWMKKTLKVLTLSQLGVALLILLLGCTCVGVSHSSYYTMTCHAGTGIWVGVLSVVSGSLGVSFAFSRTQRSCTKCLTMAYFVLAIITAVANSILIIFSSIWTAHLSERIRYRSSYGSDSESVNLLRTALGINVLLLLLALETMVSCIVALSLICYMWSSVGGCCCGNSDEKNPTVIYVPANKLPAETDNTQQQFVVVPISMLQKQGVDKGVPIVINNS